VSARPGADSRAADRGPRRRADGAAGLSLEEREALVARVRDPARRDPRVVDAYYSACIPVFREFLGSHWHTGFYRGDRDALDAGDQLRMERLIAHSAGIGAGSRVLDVGCGMGGPACHLAAVTGAALVGITPNAEQAGLARGLAARAGLGGRVKFARAVAGALPFADRSFDAVLFFESPCHFPDRRRFFAEAARVLRPGGTVAGEDWLAACDPHAPAARDRLAAVCATWAIPALGTIDGYTADMRAAGLSVREAVDLRGEMALLRGFLVDDAERREVSAEARAARDPVRRLILEGLLRLGEAARAGVFTLGRFTAVKA